MGDVIQLFKDMGPLKLASIIGAFIVVLITFILIIIKSSSHNFVPLYGNLDIKDSNKIITDLESKNIPYQLKAEGTEILVPDDKVLKLRMAMAQSGIPSKGALIGYEIFDNSETLGTSNFVQNVNLLRALEGELARTIGSFSNIESARVHLVTPKRELFSREKQSPSASIVLSIKKNIALTKEQVNAISHLVATAVPGLELSKITIVDTAGRSLKLGARDDNDPGMIASNSEEFRVAYESRMKNIIEDLLEQSIGAGHVKVQVSAEINFDRVVTNSETFDPNGQVIRSIQEIDNKESNNESDNSSNVSVATNLPGATPAGGAAANNSNSAHNDTTTNYEISKTVKNHISETGTIRRLSIAVLVDGIYKTDKKSGEISYTPRTDEELKKFNALVKSAVGFDDTRNDKVEIVNMQFVTDLSTLAEETSISWLKRELPNIVQTIVIGVVVILVLLLVIRPIAIKAFEVTRNDIEEAESIETTAALMQSGGEMNINEQEVLQEPMIDIAKIEAKFKSNMAYKSVNDIVGKYPQETLVAIRKWMNKD
jgi:flagellar M-ring protein FliF